MITQEHLISLIVLWVALVFLKAFTHHYIIEIEKTDPHIGRSKFMWWGITGIASILHATLFDPLEDWPKIFSIFAFQFLVHMVIFAPTLNRLRKMRFFYLGLNSGWFDKYFVTRPTTYKLIYFLFCILAIGSIYLLHENFN